MRRLLLALSLLLCGFTPPQDTAPTYVVPSAPVLSIWSEEPSMAVARIGDVIAIDSSAGSGSQSVTVPANASYIVVTSTGWFNSTAGWMSSGAVSIGDDALSVVREDDRLANQQSVIWGRVSPPTGERTLAWEWTLAPTEGVTLYVAFYSGVHTTSPIRSTGGSQVPASGSVSAGELKAGSGDMIIAVGVTEPTSTLTWTGVTQITARNFNANTHAFAEASPSANVSVSFASSGTYQSISAIVLRDATSSPARQYYWTAAAGSVDDWTLRVSTGTPTLAIVDDDGTDALRFRQGTTGRAAASFDLLDDAADVEILTYVRSNTTAEGTQLGHIGRLSGTLGTNMFGLYSAKFFLNSRNIDFVRFVSGALTDLASGNTADASLTDVTAYHWRKTQISGTTFRTKAWAGLVTDEPVAWGLSTTDSVLKNYGRSGLFSSMVSDNYYQIFSIGINGAEAPTEPLSTGLQLTAPADASTQSQPITFSWEVYPGALYYQLQIATDAAFTTIVHDQVIN